MPTQTMMVRPKGAVPIRKDLSQKRTVDAIRATSARYFAWDVARIGLGLDVWPSGKRAWVYQYRSPDGAQRRMKLGDANIMAPVEADRAYALARADVVRGQDPLAKRRLEQPTARARREAAKAAQLIAEAERRAQSTVADVAARYLATLDREKSARWATEARRIVCKILSPALGAMPVRALTAHDVRALRDAMHARPVMANAALRVLSAVCARAMADGDRDRASLNPCSEVDPYTEVPRDRYLTAAEWPRVAAAIIEMRDALAAAPAWDTRRAQLDALILLALTGARLNALVPRQWTDLDPVARVLCVAPSHKGVTEIALGRAARAYLEQMRSRGPTSQYLFTGQVPGRRRRHRPQRHVASLNTLWHDLRTRAGVQDTTIHDLRRSFATVAGDVGVSDHMIGGLLGHVVPGIRARYARRTSEALLEAADRVSEAVAARLGVNGPPEEAP